MLQGTRFAAVALTTLALAAWASTTARAQNGKGPWIEVAVPIEIQNDWNYRADDRANKLNDLFATIEPEATVGLLPGLSIFAHAVLEPMRDPFPGEDRIFESHGIFLEDLYVQFEGKLLRSEGRTLGFRVWGGKFTPAFGIAWDEAPGVYGTDFAEDYELVERIGFGGALTLDHAALGEHMLTASTFFLDTTVLAESLITRRPRTRLGDGGPSNTEDFSSFNVALDGTRIPGIEGLRYHVAFVKQGVRGGPDEKGFAGALMYKFEAGDVTITPLVEVARFWDADGVAGQNRNYLTTGIQLERKGWDVSVSHTLRDTTATGEDRIRDTLIQVSGGYTFENGLGIHLGWSHRNEESSSVDTFGVLLSYELSFEVGKK